MKYLIILIRPAEEILFFGPEHLRTNELFQLQPARRGSGGCVPCRGGREGGRDRGPERVGGLMVMLSS